MGTIQIGKTPDRWVVLPFFGTGALFFLLLTVLLFLAGNDLTGHYFAPRILAVTHTAALGWGTMIIFGAAYQLLPVICERSLYSRKLAMGSYWLLTPGTLLLVWSFWKFQVGVSLITGGSLIVLAALSYAINTCVTVSGSKSTGVEQYFVLSSAWWLVVTTIIGLLLAINLSHHFIPRNHLDILKLHAHAGLAGWFLQLITGVSIKLVPMFLLGKSRHTWLLYVALVCQNIGLMLFLADGYFNPIDKGMLVYALIIGTGILMWMIYLADVFRKRLKKKTDFLMRTSMLSFLWLAGSLAVLPMTFTANVRWSAIYGVFLFLGWITALILGKTFKTLPFIVWNSHYRSLTGKMKIPMPKDLYNERLTVYQYYIYILSFTSLVTGIWTGQTGLIQSSLALWILLAWIYVWNVGKIIFHKPI